MPSDARRRRGRSSQREPEQDRRADAARFHRIAARLLRTHNELRKEFSRVRFEVDCLIIRGMLDDLIWAAENCSVVGHHQVGKDLGDSGGVEWARLSKPEQDRIRRAAPAAKYRRPTEPPPPKRLLPAAKRIQALQRVQHAIGAERDRLKRLKPHIVLDCDRWALDRTVTDLNWAIEHCAVIAKHDRGKSLDDDNGYYVPPGFLKGQHKRQLKRGETVVQVNLRQLRERTSPARRGWTPNAAKSA